MSSLSPNAYVWWKDTVDSANLVYQKWLTANPLKRLKLPTTELLGRHVEGQFCRVEQKAVPMLLKSVGKELHEDIVASRVMSAAAIVYKLVRKYQPGGSNERQQLLNFLSNPEAAPNCQTAVKSLRKWRRWMVRAVEVGVSLPDPSLQVRGLDKLQPPNLPASSEFRLQTLRTQSLLDQVPSQDAVHEYAELLLAECAQVQAEVLKEASQLLKNLQVKAVKFTQDIVRRIVEGPRTAALLDSGATTCLRSAQGKEPKGCIRRRVELASGSADMWQNAQGTLVSTEAVETIVAADPLIDLDCRLDWSKKGCSLIHPARGVIPLSVSSGCPRMPEKLGLELIAEIEGSRLAKVAHGVRALRLRAQCAEWTLEQILDQVAKSIRQNLDVSAWLRALVDRLWPSLPDEVVQELASWPLDNPAASPWNRRKRRSIDKASQVFIHLFAGASARPFEHVAESCGAVPLSVDKQEALSAPQTYRYLLSVGASGKVAACIGGPPCNTHTLCRFAPNRPPPVRGRARIGSGDFRG